MLSSTAPEPKGSGMEPSRWQGGDAEGTPAAAKWAGMDRKPQAGHFLSSNELAERATDVRLRARATKALVAAIALVGAALTAERGPVRALEAAFAKAKNATARGDAKAAKKASPSPCGRAAPAAFGWGWFIPLNARGPRGCGRGARTSEGAARGPKANPPQLIRP